MQKCEEEKSEFSIIFVWTALCAVTAANPPGATVYGAYTVDTPMMPRCNWIS